MRYIQRGLDEGTRVRTVDHLGKAVLIYCAELPFVEHIEVAGVNAAVPLHNKLDLAAPVHIAGFRRLAHENRDPVLNMPDADIAPGF